MPVDSPASGSPPPMDTLTRGVIKLLDRFSRPEEQLKEFPPSGVVSDQVARIERKASPTSSASSSSPPPPVYPSSSYPEFISGLKSLASDSPELLKQIGDFMEQVNTRELKNPLPTISPDDEPGMHEEMGLFITGFINSKTAELSRLWPTKYTKPELREHLQRLVFSKVYKRVFAPTRAHKQQDALLSAKLQALELDPVSSLDLKPSLVPQTRADEGAWKRAELVLAKLSTAKAPFDKMAVISQTCTEVVGLIHARGESSIPDVFIPALIYLLVRANPPQLFSQVEFIAAYGWKPHEEPHFVHFSSAVGFLRGADERALSSSAPPPSKPVESTTTPVPEFTFEHVEETELRVGDVAQLLREYKSLVAMIKESRS